MQENVPCTSLVEVFSKEILKEYIDARRTAAAEQNYGPLKYFASKNEAAFRHFSAVNRKRTSIHQCYDAMKCIEDKIYFGTLTFNNAKNLNKRETKRKEAFKKLNVDFQYFVLVEECGSDKGRYHIHFLGLFKKDHNFDSFVKHWHSRQNLIEVHNGDIAKYMCKYLVKDLPRVRKNKNLIRLIENHTNWKNELHHCGTTEQEEKLVGKFTISYDFEDMVDLPKICYNGFVLHHLKNT